jgi:hypothetical protein
MKCPTSLNEAQQILHTEINEVYNTQLEIVQEEGIYKLCSMDGDVILNNVEIPSLKDLPWVMNIIDLVISEYLLSSGQMPVQKIYVVK